MPESDRRDLTETYHNFASHLQPGSSISSRYKIVRLLGVGGMGRVYLAKDEDLHIDVALKLIRPELLADVQAVDRFKNELILARKVSHKNVARIHDLGEIDGLKFLTMSYIPGKTLRDIIREGPMTVERAVDVLAQIAEGMSAAHEEGVIHRDLKPANILVDETDRVYVTDFGIARSLDAVDQTGGGLLLGTPAYLSPEQTWGERADTRSDIYALGLLLYEMLTGQLPFDQTTSHAFRTKLPSDLDSKVKKLHPEIPGYLIEILRKCLHPNRELRYQTIQPLLQDLKNRQVKSSFFPSRAALGIAAIVVIATLAFLLKDKWIPGKQSPVSVPIAPSSVEVKSLLILPFVNKTGAAELQWTQSGMTEMLIADLSRAPGFRVISAERLYQTMDDLKISGPDFSEEDIKRLSEILNADWILQGILLKAGQELRADLKITERDNLRNPMFVKASGNRAEDVLQISVNLADQIQKQFHADSVSEVSSETNSLPASQSFHLGMDLLRKAEFENAAAAFEQSIEQDPKYAHAYLKLSEAYEASGDPDRAAQALENALKVVNPQEFRMRHLLLAQKAFLQGELEKAIELYREFTRRYPNDADALFRMALVCEDAGDLKQAVETLDKLARIDPNHPDASFHMGKDTILMGEADKAINQYLLKALVINKRLNNRYGEADVLNAIGVGSERLGRYDDAVKHYQESLAIKEQIGNRKGSATSMSNIAKIYIFQGEHEKAREHLGKAQAIFEELKDKKGIADTANQFGVISEDQGSFTDALAHYKTALQIRKELGNDQLTAQSYDNIGHIYYLENKYDDAQVFWDQALSLRRAIGEESGIILSLQNMGFLETAQGQLDRAVKSFMEALNQSRAIQYENAIAVSLGNLGVIHQMQGRYQAAIDSYKEANQVLEKLKDKKGIAEYAKMSGSVYLELNLPQQAIDELNRALKNAEEAQSKEIIADTRILLARAYRLLNDIEKAESSIDQAMVTASEQRFEKILLRANIENAWLRLEKEEDIGESLLNLVKETEAIGDPWLELHARELLGSFQLKKNPQFSVVTCGQAIALAKKLKSLPFLYRLHSLAGRSHQALHADAKAKQQFDEAKAALSELKKLSPSLTAGL